MSQDAPAPSDPHDALFKAVFSQPAHAANLIKPLLPAAIARRIDWQTLALTSGSFVDEQLRKKHSDLLFSARLAADRQVLFYFLVEHQSSQNEHMIPFRLWLYITRVLQRYLVEHPKAQTLPAVVPLVVSHAGQPWSRPLDMLELYELDNLEREVLAPHLPRFRYLLDDLSAQSESALLHRELGQYAKLAVLALRHVRTALSFADALQRWGALLRQLDSGPEGQSQLVTLLTYMLTVGNEDPGALLHVLQSHLAPERHEVLMNTAERLVQQGRVEGGARVLLLLLRRNFDPLPEGIARRVATGSADDIERWIDRTLNGATLDEIFADNPPGPA